MIEHPVPQNVTSYEFHLVGNMTLKQFLELAAGVVIAILIYGTNLYPIIKWPLIAVFVLAGVAFAFLPINERPLDAWFLAFIRAIYNPTKYFWKRNSVTPEVFGFQASTTPKSLATEAPTRKRGEVFSLYSSTIPSKQARPAEDVDPRVQDILALYDLHPDAPLPTTPAASVAVDPAATQPQTEIVSNVQIPTADLVDGASLATNPQLADVPADQPPSSSPPTTTQLPVQLAQSDNNPISVDHPIEVFTREKPRVSSAPTTTEAHIQQANNTRSYDEVATATTNAGLPFPSKPTIPNLVVGMTITDDGHIVEDVIVEIQDEQGIPVRAFRSNKLGQFFISTPLPNGEYVIVAAKQGLSFDTIKMSLDGRIVDPVEVRATP